MPLGDDPLGEGLLGDPAVPAVLTTPPTRPRALQFNPLTRDHNIDSNGRYIDMHPVDAGVVQSMMFAVASMPGAPNVGQSLAQAEFGDQLQKDVENRVRLAVDWLVKRGDIEIVAITVEPHPARGFLAELDYVNLRLLTQDTQTASAVFGG